MWQIVKIKEDNFFWNIFPSESEYDDDDLRYDCILYGEKMCWCCIVPFERIKETIKYLNKDVISSHCVVKYDDIFLKEFVENGKVVHCVPLWRNGKGSDIEKKILQLEYKYHDIELRLEFELFRFTSTEMHCSLLSPLLAQLHYCYESIDDLQKIIKRKDEELAQFKREGHSIRRVTLITKPFEIEKHKEKYEKFSKHNFSKLTKLIASTKKGRDLNKVMANLDAQTVHQCKQNPKRIMPHGRKCIVKSAFEAIQYEQSSVSSSNSFSTQGLFSNLREISAEQRVVERHSKEFNVSQHYYGRLEEDVQINQQICERLTQNYKFKPEIKEQNLFDEETENEWYLSKLSLLPPKYNEITFDMNTNRLPTLSSNDVEIRLIETDHSIQEDLNPSSLPVCVFPPNHDISIDFSLIEDNADFLRRLESLNTRIRKLRNDAGKF